MSAGPKQHGQNGLFTKKQKTKQKNTLGSVLKSQELNLTLIQVSLFYADRFFSRFFVW